MSLWNVKKALNMSVEETHKQRENRATKESNEEGGKNDYIKRK